MNTENEIEIKEINEKSHWKIKLRTLDNQNLELEIDPLKKVMDLKKIISEKYGFDVLRQRLIYSAKQLKDDDVIQNILKDGVTVHLLIKEINISNSTENNVNSNQQNSHGSNNLNGDRGINAENSFNVNQQGNPLDLNSMISGIFRNIPNVVSQVHIIESSSSDPLVSSINNTANPFLSLLNNFSRESSNINSNNSTRLNNTVNSNNNNNTNINNNGNINNNSNNIVNSNSLNIPNPIPNQNNNINLENNIQSNETDINVNQIYTSLYEEFYNSSQTHLNNFSQTNQSGLVFSNLIRNNSNNSRKEKIINWIRRYVDNMTNFLPKLRNFCDCLSIEGRLNSNERDIFKSELSSLVESANLASETSKDIFRLLRSIKIGSSGNINIEPSAQIHVSSTLISSIPLVNNLSNVNSRNNVNLENSNNTNNTNNSTNNNINQQSNNVNINNNSNSNIRINNQNREGVINLNNQTDNTNNTNSINNNTTNTENLSNTNNSNSQSLRDNNIIDSSANNNSNERINNENLIGNHNQESNPSSNNQTNNNGDQFLNTLLRDMMNPNNISNMMNMIMNPDSLNNSDNSEINMNNIGSLMSNIMGGLRNTNIGQNLNSNGNSINRNNSTNINQTTNLRSNTNENNINITDNNIQSQSNKININNIEPDVTININDNSIKLDKKYPIKPFKEKINSQTYKKLASNLTENSKITLLQLLANLLQDYTKYECSNLTKVIGKITLYEITKFLNYDYEGIFRIKQEIIALSSKMESDKIVDYLYIKIKNHLSEWELVVNEENIKNILNKFIKESIDVLSKENISITKFNNIIKTILSDTIKDLVKELDISLVNSKTMLEDKYFATSEVIICMLSLIAGENLTRYFFDDGIYNTLGKPTDSNNQIPHNFLNKSIMKINEALDTDKSDMSNDVKNKEENSSLNTDNFDKFDTDLLFSKDIIEEISKEDSKKEFTKMTSMTSFYNDTSSFK